MQFTNARRDTIVKQPLGCKTVVKKIKPQTIVPPQRTYKNVYDIIE
jgi:hypothetical protein